MDYFPVQGCKGGLTPMEHQILVAEFFFRHNYSAINIA